MEPPDEGVAAGRTRWLDAQHAAIIEYLPDVIWTADANGPGGHIAVWSAVGRGSRVDLYLPFASQAAGAER